MLTSLYKITINVASLLLYLTCNPTYVIIGMNAPPRDYNTHGTKVGKIFTTIGATASLVFAYNTGMLPEIQVGLATGSLSDPQLTQGSREKNCTIFSLTKLVNFGKFCIQALEQEDPPCILFIGSLICSSAHFCSS